jgi:hypothetical protein
MYCLCEPYGRAAAQPYVRRDNEGKFITDQVDVGGSLNVDRRQHAKRVVPQGPGRPRRPEATPIGFPEGFTLRRREM